LLSSTLRRSPTANSEYQRAQDQEDDRFVDYYGTIQSIVSNNAQNDSGMFETNLRDERYLPFKGSGVISEWKLELPADLGKDDPCQFDYDTISDVILHLLYTPREGGSLLRDGAGETRRVDQGLFPG
jgi:hypothetical protein